jgi:hypothetical protein
MLHFMACKFLFLGPRLFLLFEKIQISFRNLFSDHFKSPLFKALVWIWIFESLLKSSRFKKYSKSLFKFILVWPSSNKDWKYLKFLVLNPIPCFKIWKGFLQPIVDFDPFLLAAGPLGPAAFVPNFLLPNRRHHPSTRRHSVSVVDSSLVPIKSTLSRCLLFK